MDELFMNALMFTSDAAHGTPEAGHFAHHHRSCQIVVGKFIHHGILKHHHRKTNLGHKTRTRQAARPSRERRGPHPATWSPKAKDEKGSSGAVAAGGTWQGSPTQALATRAARGRCQLGASLSTTTIALPRRVPLQNQHSAIHKKGRMNAC